MKYPRHFSWQSIHRERGTGFYSNAANTRRD